MLKDWSWVNMVVRGFDVCGPFSLYLGVVSRNEKQFDGG